MITKPLHLPALLLALSPTLSGAAPGVDRILRKTPHFQLLIDRSRAAKLDSLGAWAESSWHELSSLTGYSPKERIRIVFHDEQDKANGWALASNGWVNIWLLPEPFDLRGGSDWTRNVLSHELGHLFTLGALGKDGHLLYLGLAARTESKGFEGDIDAVAGPNDLEAWLTEGLAQLGAESCGHDSWDAHRDLLERVAWKSSRTLPDGLLRTFWGDARESELIYNQGYSFLRWVVAKGNSDVAKLLRDGKSDGLRSAIETSMGRKFPLLLADWRASLAARHGDPSWPTEPGRVVAPPDRAASWVHESGAVGDDQGRIWLVSSRSNDFGHGSLWESDGKRLRLIERAVHGRIRLSGDGKRLAFIHERTGADRRTIRDLWILHTASGEVERITENGRVQDADFHPEGFVVVARDGGENRVQIRDSLGALLRSLPLHLGGDLVQVACDPSGRIVATSMGSDGFRLIGLDSLRAWTGLPGVPSQARDPLWRDGRLWYSALDSGRWVAMSRDSIQERLEARFEGGTFAPFPLSPDSLLVLRFQAQGQLATKVPVHFDGKTRPLAESLPVPQPSASQPMPRRQRLVEGNPTEAGSLVGYGFIAGVRQPKESPKDPFRIGTKGFVECGILTANSSMENTLEANALVQAAGPRQNGALDFGLVLDARSEAWTPILNASYGSMRTTVEYIRGTDPGLDTIFEGDTIPYFTSTTYELGALLALTRQASIQTWYDHEDLALGAHGIEEGMDGLLRSTDRWLCASSWRDFESGRHGILSGMELALVGGRAWNWISDRNWIVPDSWLVEAHARLANHLSRRILFGAQLTGTLMDPDGHESKALGRIEATAGIPLGIAPMRIPLTSRRGWTVADPMLRVGHLTDVRPMSLAEQNDLRPASKIHRLQGGARLDRIRPPLDFARPSLVKGSTRGPDVDVSQVADVELAWKTVTLWDFLAKWSIGTTIPVSAATGWSDLAWRVSLSL